MDMTDSFIRIIMYIYSAIYITTLDLAGIYIIMFSHHIYYSIYTVMGLTY